jgi:hypothetical protein
MALVLADRVQETTTTTGTGTITLAGAVVGYQSFSVIGNGNTTYYCVTSGANWEVGIGTYTASGTTLARTTILTSSAAGAAITLAGTSVVFCVYPAGKSVYAQTDDSVWVGGTPDYATSTGNFNVITPDGGTGALISVIDNSGTSAIAGATFYAGPTGGTGAANAAYYLDKATNKFQFQDAASTTALTCEFGFNTYKFLSSGGAGTHQATLTSAGLKILGTSAAATAKLQLPAGTAAANGAPLKFTSGTNLTAIETGVVEYDGTIMTATSNTNFKRATIPLMNYTSGVGSSLTAGAETTSALLLPTANDTITLSVGTYLLDLACTFTRGTVSTTSAQARINILGGGTAVGTFSGMAISSIIAGGASSNFSFSAVNINSNNLVTAASTTVSGVYTITLKGVMKITTAGTIIPSYTLSAILVSAGTATVPAVLYFTLQQMDSQSATNFGPAGTGWG